MSTATTTQQVDRRTFFKRFAQVAGVLAVGTGAGALKPSTAEAFFSFGPKIDPRWKGLVSQLKEYVTCCYVKYDAARAKAALAALGAYGISETDVSPLQTVNRCLMSKGLFLTYFYVESPAIAPAVKLFTIAKRDVFAGFMVEGRKRTKLFGIPLEDYDRALLGEEVFSTVNAPPVAQAYNLAPARVVKTGVGDRHSVRVDTGSLPAAGARPGGPAGRRTDHPRDCPHRAQDQRRAHTFSRPIRVPNR